MKPKPKPTPTMPWSGDPLGDVANAHAIPEDEGLCLFCFNSQRVFAGRKIRCPLCKGTGHQTPALVRAYKEENKFDLLKMLQ